MAAQERATAENPHFRPTIGTPFNADADHPVLRAGVQDIEIPGSHIGMGWNPAVLRVVADRLAQRPGDWQPYALDQQAATRH